MQLTVLTRFALILAALTTSGGALAVDPESDRQALRAYYEKRFPDVPIENHKDGVYAIDAAARDQWLEMEDFPPYEIAVDEGESRYATPFASGAGYADCFGEEGSVRQNYPFFDEDSGQVITLEMAINDCRERHGEAPLAYGSQELNELVAYMAFASRGQTVALATPSSPAALAAFEDGKRFYSTRRGQLNFACATCHVQMAGNMLRAEKLSATVGHVTHWPVYRFKWEQIGSLHKRFQECNSQVRAEPFAEQSEAYRNLEYFLTYMSRGLEWNGPATRK